MTSRPYQRSQLLSWALVFVFGLLLAAMALPRLAAEVFLLRSAQTVDVLTNASGKPSRQDLDRAAKDLDWARRFSPTNPIIANQRATIDLALYDSERGRTGLDGAFSFLEQAEEEIGSALHLSSGNANLWYLLAETGARLSGPNRQVLQSLQLSYLAGPREGWVARRRLGLALRLWPLLSANTQNMVRREIATLWSLPAYRTDLARIYLGSQKPGAEALLEAIAERGGRDRFLRLIDQSGNKS